MPFKFNLRRYETVFAGTGGGNVHVWDLRGGTKVGGAVQLLNSVDP